MRRGPYLPWRRRLVVQRQHHRWLEAARLATTPVVYTATDENCPLPSGVAVVHPCPLGKGCQPDPNCTNRAQCWEPCGRLGNDPAHAKAADQKHADAIDKALGVTVAVDQSFSTNTPMDPKC